MKKLTIYFNEKGNICVSSDIHSIKEVIEHVEIFKSIAIESKAIQSITFITKK